MARRHVVLMGGPPITQEEEAALEAITPGHILMYATGGVQKNTANAANVVMMVALEREELGKTIDDAYAVGDTVKVAVLHPGQRAYLFLASGQNVAKGDYLTTNNAGLLTATGVTTALRSAQALEAVDASGSAPVAGTRIRVQIV